MFIKMLQTVEDSHKYFVKDETGEPVDMAFDVRKFLGEAVYDMDQIPGGDKRGQELIAHGYAEEVDPADL